MSDESFRLVNEFGDACVVASYPRLPSVENALIQREALLKFINAKDARIAELERKLASSEADCADAWFEQGNLERERDAQDARIAELERENERLMLRSVGAMAIAEGDEGYELVPLDCPMLVAVAALRARNKIEPLEDLLTRERIAELERQQWDGDRWGE